MPVRRGVDHARYKHGNAGWKNKSLTYRRWCDMKTRCLNAKSKSYPRYGGRGIKVCERWLVFDNFLADMGEPPTAKHQLERKDNEKGYEPGNCRWATCKEQANNRRSSHLVEMDGQMKTIAQWAESVGVKAATIARRLRTGKTPEEAIKAPVRQDARWHGA